MSRNFYEHYFSASTHFKNFAVQQKFFFMLQNLSTDCVDKY